MIFLYFDKSSSVKEDVKIAKVLVEINVSRGLVLDIEVRWHNKVFLHILDY